uniref:Uncharacterized protein MANES_06G116500 n=1 Tax=Rhizophora mucronata TaxID=61149 RepID=A0A2P2KU57_RHIMU
MATSAFKSTTKRTPSTKSSSSSPKDPSSSNQGSSIHRRSRSLSRFSHRIPTNADDFSEEASVPHRGRFVNTVKASGFPEISLDDLAIRSLNSADRGGSDSRLDDVSPGDKASASQRRGRSVSRHSSRVGVGKGNGGSIRSGGRVNQESNSRRRRSVSVVRYQASDSSETDDLDHPQNSRKHTSLKSFIGGHRQMALSDKTTALDHRQGLRRSLSQRDLKYHDGYSSQSSVLTDDEGKNAHNQKNAVERMIQAVYAQKKAEHPADDDTNSELYEAMRKGLRHALEEIKMELKQAMGKTNTPLIVSENCSQPRISSVRRSYTSQLEQPEKYKQDLLAEVLLEEQCGRDHTKIVKKLLPKQDNIAVEKPLHTRKRSNDRNRMSRRLTEEAERYIEDFISNIEDTDISSWDGERSDTSSSIGGITKMEAPQTPAISKPLASEMDGVALPWLQWETCNDCSPLSGKNMELTATSKTKLWDGSQVILFLLIFPH